MSELDEPGKDDAGTPDFNFMVDGWPDRITVRHILQRAGSSDAVTIVSEVPLGPRFIPKADVRATSSQPALR